MYWPMADSTEGKQGQDSNRWLFPQEGVKMKELEFWELMMNKKDLEWAEKRKSGGSNFEEMENQGDWKHCSVPLING